MASSKLSPTEKHVILQLYSEMSNTELAQRFGVSISTIARVIKEGKDQALIQPKKGSKQLDLIPAPEELAETPDTPANEGFEPIEELAQAPASETNEELQDTLGNEGFEPIEELEALEAVVGDDFEEDTDLEEEEDQEEDEPIEEPGIPAALTILPLYELGVPEMCYLVIDKAAEVVTRPLKDFRDLGLLPTDQEQCRTLPLFRNHRLARRFSNPHQRIIKMPGHLLHATQEKLKQKGITYILFNSRVYSL